MAVPVCPMCGSTQQAALFAVADVLVFRALEVVGKRIVRSDRARFARLGNRSWHLAHTLWRPEERTVTKALNGAWDVVPAMLVNYGCCGVDAEDVVNMLDRYVKDLLITGTPHTLDELHYRFHAILGIEVLVP